MNQSYAPVLTPLPMSLLHKSLTRRSQLPQKGESTRWLSTGFFKIAPQSIDLLSQHCNPLLVAAGHGNGEGELQFFEAMVSLNKTRACRSHHR